MNSVLEIFADRIRSTEIHWGANSGADKGGAEALEAVAEYIAANDEYDAAWVAMCYDQGTDTEARFSAAKVRRALAHARMKGETK